MIYASKTPESINTDPKPYIYPKTGYRASPFESVSLDARNGFDPALMPLLASRPEYTPTTTHPANPIMVAYRKFGPDLFGGIEGWIAWGLDGLYADGVRITREHSDHARRVLTRLANFSA